MTNLANTFRLTAIAAAMLSMFSVAHADDDELTRLTKPESSISVGAGYQSNDRLQQGIFDGMRDKGAYGLVDIDVVKRDDGTGTWYIFRGAKLGQESRSFEAEVQRQGDIGGFVSYKRIPREHPLMISSELTGIGSESLTINGGSFRKVELNTYRDLVQVGFNKNLMEGLDIKFSFKNEEKNGNRHWGAGSQPYFLAEPIDSVTQQFDVTLEYSGERLQMAGGYAGSWYRNDNDLVMATIIGQTTNTTSNPNPIPLSQTLDNQAHQLFLNAGYSINSSTRATLKLSRSVATQDESIPSLSLGAPNNPFVGAPSSLDGEIVTSLIELGLTSHPTSDLSLSGNLRYYDIDDKTPLVGLVGSNTTGVATVHNTPHSYTTNSGKLEAAYRLPDRFKLIAGVDVKQQDRSAPKFLDERFVPYAEEIDETTYRMQLRRSMSDTLNGAIAFLHSERDGSSRVSPHDPEIFDAINPLHIADRTRNKWRLSLDWAPVEPFSMQFNVEDSRDNYQKEDDRPFGLKDGRATLVSVDAQYAFNDTWQLTGWASHDVTRAKQLAGEWPRNTTTIVPRVFKDADLKDTGDSVGLGVRGAVSEKLKLGADVQWTRTQSSYDEDIVVTAPGVTQVPLKDIESTLTRISVFATYAIRKNADLRIGLMHERWKTDDWSWSFADGSTFAYGGADGTTVAIKPKETVNFASIRYIYKFQ